MEEKELIKGEVKGYLELAKFGAKIRRASC